MTSSASNQVTRHKSDSRDSPDKLSRLLTSLLMCVTIVIKSVQLMMKQFSVTSVLHGCMLTV